jgi:hypothetical protein
LSDKPIANATGRFQSKATKTAINPLSENERASLTQTINAQKGINSVVLKTLAQNSRLTPQTAKQK